MMIGRRVTQKSMTYLCMMFRSNGYGQLRARGLNQHYIDNKDNSQLITSRITCIHNSVLSTATQKDAHRTNMEIKAEVRQLFDSLGFHLVAQHSFGCIVRRTCQNMIRVYDTKVLRSWCLSSLAILYFNIRHPHTRRLKKRFSTKVSKP